LNALHPFTWFGNEVIGERAGYQGLFSNELGENTLNGVLGMVMKLTKMSIIISH
jgi:hypothetical protein